jgi:hypothetical protein
MQCCRWGAWARNRREHSARIMISRGSDGPDHRIRSLPFDFRLSPLSFPAFPVSISNLPLASLSRAHTTGSAHPPLLAAPRNPNPTRPLRMSASEASPAEQPAPPAAAPAASTESSPTPSPAVSASPPSPPLVSPPIHTVLNLIFFFISSLLVLSVPGLAEEGGAAARGGKDLGEDPPLPRP